MDHFVRVEQNDARKKTVNVKNIEPLSNIEIVRDYSSSDTSSVSSGSSAPKKTKKIFFKLILRYYILSGTSIPSSAIHFAIILEVVWQIINLNCKRCSSSTFKIGSS